MPDTRPTIDDMVFENRNKEYGSYHLRKRFNARLGIGLLVSLSIGILSALGYLWYLTAAGDENIYLYPSQLPYLKSVQGSLLTKEQLNAYMGSPAQPEKMPDPIEKNLRDRHRYLKLPKTPIPILLGLSRRFPDPKPLITTWDCW